MRQVGKEYSEWMASTVAMILTLSMLFSHPESYLDVGSLGMYLRAGQHCKQSNGSYWSTLSFGGLRRQVLLKYYDVKDPLSLVQKISKKVLSMPKSPRDTALYSVPWKSVPPVMMRPRS